MCLWCGPRKQARENLNTKRDVYLAEKTPTQNKARRTEASTTLKPELGMIMTRETLEVTVYMHWSLSLCI